MADATPKTANEMRDYAKSVDTLRPAPSDQKGYPEWASRSGVKRNEDQHYDKAKRRGEVK